MGGKTTALKLVCPKSGLRANHGSAWLYRANIKIQDFFFCLCEVCSIRHVLSVWEKPVKVSVYISVCLGTVLPQ